MRAGGGGSRRLRGSFPYDKTAVLSRRRSQRWQPRKEQFAPGAFAYSLEITDASTIHLLVGHSYDKPLASNETGTLAFNDTREALTFDATIAPEIASDELRRGRPGADLGGLAVGISPGFRFRPRVRFPPIKPRSHARTA